MKLKSITMAAAIAVFAMPALARDTVRYGSLTVPLQTLAGISKGFFAEENIEVEYTFYKSGSEIAPAVATGQVEVAVTTAGAALFNAMARGAEFTIVAEALRIEPGAPGGDPTAIMVPTDSDIESGADLTGKRIAITAPGQILDMIVNEYLAQNGLSPDDVEKISMGPPDMVPALTNGSIDAAVMFDPFISIVTGDGTARRLAGSTEILPGASQAFLVFSNGMMENEELAERFLRAYKRSNGWIREALTTPEGRKELAEIYQSHVPARDASTYERIALMTASPDLKVNVDEEYGLRWQMQTLIDIGLIPNVPDLDAHLDNALLDQATGQ